MVNQNVKDWENWIKIFDSRKPIREAAGLTDRAMGYEEWNHQMVMFVDVVNDLKKAKAYFNSAELKDLMKAAGVEGEPTVYFYKLVKKFCGE